MKLECIHPGSACLMPFKLQVEGLHSFRTYRSQACLLADALRSMVLANHHMSQERHVLGEVALGSALIQDIKSSNMPLCMSHASPCIER